jgi:hypothetical protein
MWPIKFTVAGALPCLAAPMVRWMPCRTALTPVSPGLAAMTAASMFCAVHLEFRRRRCPASSPLHLPGQACRRSDAAEPPPSPDGRRVVFAGHSPYSPCSGNVRRHRSRAKDTEDHPTARSDYTGFGMNTTVSARPFRCRRTRGDATRHRPFRLSLLVVGQRLARFATKPRPKRPTPRRPRLIGSGTGSGRPTICVDDCIIARPVVVKV